MTHMFPISRIQQLEEPSPNSGLPAWTPSLSFMTSIHSFASGPKRDSYTELPSALLCGARVHPSPSISKASFGNKVKFSKPRFERVSGLK